MKRKLYLIVVGVICFSCTSTKYVAQEKLAGEFYGKSPGISKGVYDRYTLTLNTDSTFYFEINIHDANPGCDGKWWQSGDSLFLKCSDTESLTDKLSNGYMNQREHEFEILSLNRLKYKDTILKRKK